MKRKIYKLLASAKQELFALILTVFLGTAYSQTTYTFNFTASEQTINLPAGTYTIEMWGADGGDNLGNGTTTFLQNGGKGGYSKGTYSLTSAGTIYVNVGGRGSNSTSSLNVTAPGGYNGGGYGSANSVSGKSSGAGGGGATHVATATGTLGALVSNQSAVPIVAGGGGGPGESNYASNNTTYNSNGGNGGGTSGLQNISSSYPGRHGKGGTQTAGGGGGDNGSAVAGVPLQGIFGAGGYNTATGANTSAGGSGAGGGGGGWYGGGSGWVSTGSAYQAGAGGGGSGYIGGVTSGVTIDYGQPGFVTRPNVTGDGIVLITEGCSINLMASTASPSNPVICSGQSLTLTTNAISNYSWSTGATTSSLVVAPTTNTVYSLSATSPSNCTASRSISVTVTSGGQPTLSVVTSTNQTCLGKTATLTASGAINYTWTNGVTNGVSFYPSATQTYTVTGDNGCGTVTALATISVNPLAMTAVSSATAVCTNKTATLSVTVAATSYTWNPGNVTGSSPNLIVNPQANTVYTITASDGTCSGVANVSLVANPVPTITSSSSSSIVCPGGTINLSATGGVNYTWTPVNLNGASITVSPTASTLYNVVGDNNFGCLGNSSQVIVAGTQPTVMVSSSSSTICGGESATLTTSGANTYAWTGGPTTTVYVVSPTQLTTYTIVGTNSSSGCTDTETITVDVYTPVIAITGNTAVCDGDAANLTASGVNGYVWNPGNLPFASIAVTPNTNTTYTVNGIGTSGILNCPASATIHVIVNPNPTVTAAATPTAICPKETTTITASGASTYTWAGTSTTTVGSSIQVSSPNVAILIYTLTGTSALGCRAEITIPLTVSACTGLEHPDSYREAVDRGQLAVYPNPSNGEFTLLAESDMSLSLVNELGQVVKQVQLNKKNDFRISVSYLSNGIYFIVGDGVSRKIIVNK